MTVRITGAEVTDDNGTAVARIESILVGGGDAGRWDETRTNIVWVTDPLTQHYHVRLIAPDRMLSDELLTVDTYEEAVILGEAYLAKREKHAELISDFQQKMQDV